MLKLGLMGLGAIGVDVEKMVTQECKGDIEIPAILVKNPEQTDRLMNRLSPQILTSSSKQNRM